MLQAQFLLSNLVQTALFQSLRTIIWANLGRLLNAPLFRAYLGLSIDYSHYHEILQKEIENVT